MELKNRIEQALKLAERDITKIDGNISDVQTEIQRYVKAEQDAHAMVQINLEGLRGIMAKRNEKAGEILALKSLLD